MITFIVCHLSWWPHMRWYQKVRGLIMYDKKNIYLPPTFEIITLCSYTLVLVFQPLLESRLEVIFCKQVRDLQFALDLSGFKMSTFELHFHLKKNMEVYKVLAHSGCRSGTMFLVRNSHVRNPVLHVPQIQLLSPSNTLKQHCRALNWWSGVDEFSIHYTTFLKLTLVANLPDNSSSSWDVAFLKHLCHSKLCLWPIASSL